MIWFQSMLQFTMNAITLHKTFFYQVVSQRFVNFQKWYSKRSDDFDIPLLAEEVIITVRALTI